MAKKLVALIFIAACTIGDKEYAKGDKESFEPELAAELIAKEMAKEAEPEAEAKGKTVKVRMLRDHHHEGDVLPCNSVQAVPVALAKSLVQEGAADDTAAAVAYAEGVAREEAATKRRIEKK